MFFIDTSLMRRFFHYALSKSINSKKWKSFYSSVFIESQFCCGYRYFAPYRLRQHIITTTHSGT